MKWYELVFGLFSLIGMVLSIIALVTTQSTKAALGAYRKKQDSERLQESVDSFSRSHSRGKANQQIEHLDSLRHEINRYSILYDGSISPDLESAMTAAKNSIDSIRENLGDKNAQKNLNSSLSTVSALLEKESR